jgi:putative hydrolase of the HAD superfamily
MGFDLVCVDLFQTLVNMDARFPAIWKRVLGENCGDAIATECTRAVFRHVVAWFYSRAESTAFLNLRSQFEPCFQKVLSEMGIDFDPRLAVDIFVDEHRNAPPYEDTAAFFEALDGRLPVCLVTDADVVMAAPHVSRFPFDCVFISETVRSYKNDACNRIFRAVIERYGVEPERVLHIGDSISDIAGARRAGMKTCWLNRTGALWTHKTAPDFTAASLIDVVKIIEEEGKN